MKADGALRRLQDVQSITMDPDSGTVYKNMPYSGLEEDTFGISDPRD